MGVTGVSPLPLVSDVDRSVAYYRDRLGFTCETYGDPPTFASAQRDGSSILLALCPEADRIVPNWRIVDQTWNVYVRVDDADAVYADVQERGAAIDYSLYDAPHGFREFGVQEPDGYDIAFGQPLADPSVQLTSVRDMLLQDRRSMLLQCIPWKSGSESCERT